MKLISTHFGKFCLLTLFSLVLVCLAGTQGYSQVCLNPGQTIYGIDGSGNVYPIDVASGNVGAQMNPAYTGNAPAAANGLGYNPLNGRFYYFKRMPSSPPGEFVAFDPAFNTITLLAACPSGNTIHTGCISNNGKGYYCIDVNANMYYYNIPLNTWTAITSTFYDNFGANITSVITARTSGDIAIDGFGNLWYICSGGGTYGLYKFTGPLPTGPVASMTATQVISPSTGVPSGSGFQGAAFTPSGDLLLSTGSGDNKLYQLTTSNTLSLVSTFSQDGVGNDLTSCNFPFGVLPVLWEGFAADLQGHNVSLNWTVAQEYDTRDYTIEHSLDGKTWEAIGTVNPAGIDKSQSRTYSFLHTSPVNGAHFYRIRENDLNGNSSYSAVKSVNISGNSQVAIWPNPAYDQVRITQQNNDNSGVFRAQLFDQSGRMVSENTLHTGTSTLDVHALPAGTYIVRVQLASGDTYNQKLIKK